MSGLWVNQPETAEGKYPIVLRRDGSVLTTPYLVMTLRDPCAAVALRAYADEAHRRGLDPQYVIDMHDLARRSTEIAASDPGDPDAPRHRTDDPIILAWARLVHGPKGAGQ